METTLSSTLETSPKKASLWTGRIISWICILFLLLDAIAKIFKESHSVSGSLALGIPESAVQGIGVLLLICTVFYIIPRTAILGAILLTGYLGGAIAIMLRAGQPLYFAFVFGVLVWTGLVLRDIKARKLLI